MKRREFVRILGSAVGGLAVPFEMAPGSQGNPGDADPGWTPGIEQLTNSTCTLCPGGCGINCRVVDGSLVGIKGSTFNPINRGGVCPSGMAGIQHLYNPDRLKGPMARDGEKGSGKWREISWEEGFALLNEKIAPYKSAGDGSGVAFLSGAARGTKADLIHILMRSFGEGAEVYLDDAIDAYPHVFNLVHGIPRYPAFDFESSDIIFSFGADLLNAWWCPLQAQTAYGSNMGGSADQRGNLVQFEHRLSNTGAQAGEWVPVNPGSYGAMALGMAYVLIKEELYDRDFVSLRTTGFDNWIDDDGISHVGLKDLILQLYYPEEVSRITGVEEETIIRLGKEFGKADSAVAVGDYMASYNKNGLYSLMAVHVLNLLGGSVNKSGGITVQRDLPLTPLNQSIPPGRQVSSYIAEGGVAFDSADRRIDKFPERVLWGSTKGVDLLFVYKTNPIFAQANNDAFEEALKKVPFVVSFASFQDETTQYADLVLPDHVFLESWDDVISPPTFPFPIWGLVKPVVSPSYDTRNCGDIILKLTKELDESAAADLPASDMKGLLEYRARGLFESKRGMILDRPFEKKLLGSLEERGWWIRSRVGFDDFWKNLVDRGGWCDPFVDWDNWDAVCGNDDRKIHFYIPELGELEGNELASMPHHEGTEIRSEIDYPLLLVPFRMSRIDGGEGGKIPWVIESSGPMAQLLWDGWVEVNPVTADRFGVKNGDSVWVESKRGKIKLRANVRPGIVEGVVSVPAGLGHKVGTWSDVGANVMDVVEKEYEKRTGLPSWQTTPVKIYRA